MKLNRRKMFVKTSMKFVLIHRKRVEHIKAKLSKYAKYALCFNDDVAKGLHLLIYSTETTIKCTTPL